MGRPRLVAPGTPDLAARARTRLLLCGVLAAAGIGLGTGAAVLGAVNDGGPGAMLGGLAIAVVAVAIAAALGRDALLWAAAQRRAAQR